MRNQKPKVELVTLRQIVWQVAILISVFFAGISVGNWRSQPFNSRLQQVVHGSVLHLEDLPLKGTSHAGISKKVFIEPFAKIPNFSGFQVATLQPGQRVETHEHKTMHEVFYVISGRATFTVENVEHPTSPGTLVHLAPHERHSILAQESAQGDLVIAYFGVTI